MRVNPGQSVPRDQTQQTGRELPGDSSKNEMAKPKRPGIVQLMPNRAIKSIAEFHMIGIGWQNLPESAFNFKHPKTGQMVDVTQPVFGDVRPEIVNPGIIIGGFFYNFRVRLPFGIMVGSDFLMNEVKDPSSRNVPTVDSTWFVRPVISKDMLKIGRGQDPIIISLGYRHSLQKYEYRRFGVKQFTEWNSTPSWTLVGKKYFRHNHYSSSQPLVGVSFDRVFSGPAKGANRFYIFAGFVY